jgi:spermidine synthase
MRHALLFSVFVIASCGLAYELIAGALSSYLLGDSVTQFSTVIGTYLFAMGAGSWLSKYITRDLIGRFIQIELMVGLLGGFSAIGLFVVFAWLSGPFKLVLYLAVFGVGVLVGLEIPLVMRILKRELAFKDLVSQVLTFDYLGALVVSILFPLVLAPQLAWCAPACCSACSMWLSRCGPCICSAISCRPGAGWRCKAGLFGLLAPVLPGPATDHLRRNPSLRRRHRACRKHALSAHRRHPLARRPAPVPEQQPAVFIARRIPLPRGAGPSRAGQPARGEARAGAGWRRRPGGSRSPQVSAGRAVTLVDLDPAMTDLFSTAPAWWRSTRGAQVGAGQGGQCRCAAMAGRKPDYFDFIVIDFPDPTNFALGKLYTSAFYRLLEKRLSANGLLVVQSTSPLYARQSFWCVVTTLESVGFKTAPYHAQVPSFGEWGYIIAGRQDFVPGSVDPRKTRFDAGNLPGLFVFRPTWRACRPRSIS